MLVDVTQRLRALDHAAMEEEHAVADLLDLRELVRVEEHRRAARLLFGDQVAHEQHAVRIEAGRRLVEKEIRRLVDQRLAHADALEHAARVLREPLVRRARRVPRRSSIALQRASTSARGTSARRAM